MIRSKTFRHASLALLTLAGLAAFQTPAVARDGFFSREQVMSYTPEWKGERFPDGRPKVSDDILARMREVTLEKA